MITTKGCLRKVQYGFLSLVPVMPEPLVVRNLLSRFPSTVPGGTLRRKIYNFNTFLFRKDKFGIIKRLLYVLS